ncbi:hypothetical protein [Cucumibacter marinus]|uniref:hypothetical protein n=1 Tax=Cucumibacter marinus TaxID=1121252 RepID=UPI0003FE92DA|nr:hypothetical protein [Cucumibacter marinus]
MKSEIALLKREFLEHRAMFLYAPAILIGLLIVIMVGGLLFGDANPEGDGPPNGETVMRVGLMINIAVWTGLGVVALFFYYADAFSADRRHNNMLFWKSMPQSDLKILGLKAASSLAVFMPILFVWAAITGIVIYLGFIGVGFKFDHHFAPNPLSALLIWIEAGLSGIIFMVLSVLWYAPVLAWVAGLSTVFGRWSIPLAFIIPGFVVLMERLYLINRDAEPVIANFLAHRLDGETGTESLEADIVSGSLDSIWNGLAIYVQGYDWIGMVGGVAFAVAVVYLASEYRRRLVII